MWLDPNKHTYVTYIYLMRKLRFPRSGVTTEGSGVFDLEISEAYYDLEVNSCKPSASLTLL